MNSPYDIIPNLRDGRRFDVWRGGKQSDVRALLHYLLAYAVAVPMFLAYKLTRRVLKGPLQHPADAP